MGRMPDAKAVRRVGKPMAEVLPDTGSKLVKPQMAVENPCMSRIWDQLISDAGGFEECDAPFMESLVFNLAVVDECRRNILDENGNVRPLVKVETDDGEILVKPNPYQRAMKDAETMALKLAQEMGLTRFCRAKLGLTQAMSQEKVALSIANEIDRALGGRK